MSTDGKSDGALKPNDLQRLHEFCRRGNVDMVEELLRKPQEKGQELVHQQGELGNYALHWAAQGGYVEVLQMVLNFRAKVNATNTVNDTPLHVAAWRDNIECVEALLNAGADKSLKNKDKKTPLDLARSKSVRDLLPELTEAQLADVIQAASSSEEEDDSDDDDEVEGTP